MFEDINLSLPDSFSSGYDLGSTSLGDTSGFSSSGFTPSLPSSDPFAGIGLSYTSAFNPAGQAFNGVTSTTFATPSTSGSSNWFGSSGFWDGASKLTNIIGGLTNSAATIYKAVDGPSNQTAGYYAADGSFHSLKATGNGNAPVTAAAQPTNAFGQITGSIGSVFSAIAGYIPWILLIAVAAFAFRMFTKKR